MPTKRRIAKGRDNRITPEALAAFAAGDWMGLHQALGLRPWQPSPLDTVTPQPPAYARHRPLADAWPLAFELRCKLEAAKLG
jgi:hypothetical protein